MSILLRIDKLSAWYGDTRVLNEVDIEIKEGEIVALLGRNGMGKTTTLHSVCGITEKVSGKIFFKNNLISNLPSYEISKLGIGLVPEGRRIFSNLTVEENLIVASRKGYWDLNKIKQIFPRLSERLTQMSNSLSGGEQQMLAIGRSLVINPSVIMLDEPSQGLAPMIVEDVKEMLLKLKKEGMSIILVEQNLQTALDVADRVYILDQGEIVFEGKSEELSKNKKLTLKFLGVST